MGPVGQGRPLKVLISGAGIAGAALACLLDRGGHEVLVVERDQGVRSSGNPVDVRGPAYAVVDELGLLARLRERATGVRELVFVDPAGRRLASLPTRRSDRELEVSRADLCAALVASAGRADFRFDDTITSLDQDDEGVDVSFERGRNGRFDLVVGADGLHSMVRRLAFGPETDFVRRLGIYIATARLPIDLGRDDTVWMHSRPGAAVAVHPGSGQPGVAFMFRSRAVVDSRDRAGAERLVARTYGTMGWRAPELLAGYLAAEEPYFDAVSRVSVTNWSRGRVVLLGDAASCVSLFGEGSSAAVAGAAALADSVSRTPDDIAGALVRYQSRHQRLTRHGQRGAAVAARLLIPATRTGITARDRVLRLTGHR